MANFGWALKKILIGETVRRDGWPDPGCTVTFCPGRNGEAAALLLRTRDGGCEAWFPDELDLVATDWVRLGDEVAPKSRAKAMSADVYIERGFEVGDVVTLRSGGQAMTVTSTDCEEIEVSWIEDDGKPHERYCHPEVLIHAEIPF